MTEVEPASETCFLYVYIEMSSWKISNIRVSLIGHLHHKCFEVNYLWSLICKRLISFSGCKIIYFQLYACILSHVFVSPSQLHHFYAANRWLIRWKTLLCFKPVYGLHIKFIVTQLIKELPAFMVTECSKSYSHKGFCLLESHAMWSGR
jgi:hypothetical protein